MEQALNSVVLNVIRYLHNGGIAAHFLADREDGRFTVNNGKIDFAGDYLVSEWIVLTGSRLNNGVYMVNDYTAGEYELSDGNNPIKMITEPTFSGTVYRLVFPSGFVNVCRRIMEYGKSPHGDPAQKGAIISEGVLGFHNWTKATGADGLPLGWEKLFRSQLPPHSMFYAISV